MLRVVWLLGFVVLAASAIAVAARGSEASSSALVIDRTIECTVPGVGFPESVRYLDGHASPRMGSGASLSDPTANFFTQAEEDEGVVGFVMGRQGRTNTPGLYVNRSSCKVTAKRPIFSSRGLRGGRITLAERYKCDVPTKVRVRVRAVFTRSVALRPYREYYLRASGRIVSAQVVVTTVRGKRMLYASADSRTGRAQLFHLPARCFPV